MGEFAGVEFVVYQIEDNVLSLRLLFPRAELELSLCPFGPHSTLLNTSPGAFGGIMTTSTDGVAFKYYFSMAAVR
jgi:hypothetical protein